MKNYDEYDALKAMQELNAVIQFTSAPQPNWLAQTQKVQITTTS